jgi:MoaA/NifB/PqqE/SkfB family radical SAM enzyme
LKTWEFNKIFDSLGDTVFWATLSGGEPYLRQDLPEICEALCEHCKPSIINIPTNSLLPEIVEDKTKKILERCNCPSIIVNLSLDGLKEEHDILRGVPGNFNNFFDTYNRLRGLKAEFANLHVGVHSVVSKYNVNKLLNVYEYAKNLQCDSYITEVAEHRSELFNKDENITPTSNEYAMFVEELGQRIKHDGNFFGNSVSRTTQAFRLTYYQLAAQTLKKHRQTVSCYAGYASCQISAYGDIWPCCILGYDYSMGNIRENDYDFQKIWFSQRAQDVRNYIKSKRCACPLANAHYTNILCNFTACFKVIKNLLLL